MVYYKVPQRSSSQYLLGHSQIHMEGSPNYDNDGDNDDNADDDGDRENIKKQLKPIVLRNLDLNIELDILPGSH